MDIESIRRRVAGATPGPWRRHGADIRVDDGGEPLFQGRDGGGAVREQADRDAEFVAHAREDLLLLLEALDDAPEELIGRHRRAATTLTEGLG